MFMNSHGYTAESTDGQPGAFACCLDAGLAGTTTWNKGLGALKGAVDGGLSVPHSTKRLWLWFRKKGIHCRSTLEALHGSEHCRLYVLPDWRRWRCFQEIILSIHKEQCDSRHDGGDYKKPHAAVGENPVYEKKPEKEG